MKDIAIDVFEKAERTLIEKKILEKNSRENAIKENEKMIEKFKNAKDNDFYLQMTMVVFYSGFRAKTVENKKETIKKYFGEIKKVINYSESDIKKIQKDEDMIRNRKKIEALIYNAKEMNKIINEYGGFRNYIYSFNKDFPESEKNIDDLKNNLIKRFKYLSNATVNHFLMDYGFKVIKPDRMVLRVLYRSKLIESEKESEYNKCIEIGRLISNELKIPIRYVDTVFVLLGQKGICTKNHPKCNECKLELICKFY